MNVLLINHYAGSRRLGMELRHYYLAREWVKLGCQVTIVAASYSHLRVEQPHTSDSELGQDLEGIRYVWLRTSSYTGNGVGRMRNMLGFLVALRRFRTRLLDHSRPHVVIASSTYHLDVPSARWIARRSQAKFIYEVRDLWPLTLVELGGMANWNPLITTLRIAESYAYRKADLIVSTLPDAAAYMRERGMPDNRFVYLPNGIDVADWHKHRVPLPLTHARQLETLKHDGRFIVGYAGTHGAANALDPLLETAALLPQMAFVLAGQGPAKERLQKKVAQMGLSNVIFLPPVPPASVPALLNLMDVLYLGWARKQIYRFGISPNKLLDYMMAAKPIVHAVEASNDAVASCGCGVSCPPESPPALARSIELLMGKPVVEREAMGQRGRQYVMLHHDYAVLARRYMDVMV